MGCWGLQGVEAATELVDLHELPGMATQLIVVVIAAAMDAGLLDGPVHSLDLEHTIRGWYALVPADNKHAVIPSNTAHRRILGDKRGHSIEDCVERGATPILAEL